MTGWISRQVVVVEVCVLSVKRVAAYCGILRLPFRYPEGSSNGIPGVCMVEVGGAKEGETKNSIEMGKEP